MGRILAFLGLIPDLWKTGAAVKEKLRHGDALHIDGFSDKWDSSVSFRKFWHPRWPRAPTKEHLDAILHRETAVPLFDHWPQLVNPPSVRMERRGFKSVT